MPPPLLPARWALTPPFHPYPPRKLLRQAVCFLWHYPSTRHYIGLPSLAKGIAPCGVWTFLHPELLQSSGYPPFQKPIKIKQRKLIDRLRLLFWLPI